MALTTSVVGMLACRAPIVADAAPGTAPSAVPETPKVAPSAPPPSPTSPLPPPAPTASATKADARRVYVVAAMGDSLTDFRAQGGRYLKLLQEKCPSSRFDSYGVGGQMVNQMRKRLAADILGIPPDSGPSGKPKYTHVIVFGGVNDLYSDLTAGRTVKKITTDLGAMYAAAHEHGLVVVAMTVTPWGGFTRYFTPARAATTAELNRWILAQPKAGTVDFAVDAYPLLSCGTPDLLCEAYSKPYNDGLHFGPEGHERLAEALFRDVFADCR